MIFYYYLYFISSLFVFIERKLKFKKFIFFLIFIYLFLIILIGFRFEVGGDWENYNFAYTQFAKVNFLDIFTKSISDDILFDLVQWISFRFFNNIYLGNILCAFIFVSGLIRIAYVTPYPFFFITLAIPYLLVAVSMGYTRQSVAIGLFMWGICLLLKKNNLSYFFLILFGSFFHKSAALLFFFLFVNIPLNFTKLFLYSFFFIILILFFVIPRIDIVLQHFLIVEYATSAGVFHRLFLNLFAAIIFLITYKKWEINNSEKRLYTMFVIFTFILLVSAFFNSIIVDRIAIYLIPIQLLILTNATNLINNNFIKNIYILSLLYFYFLVLYIWLNLGHYSIYWVPYRNYLF